MAKINEVPIGLKLFAAIAAAIIAGTTAWGIVADPLTSVLDLQTRTLAEQQHEALRTEQAEVLRLLNRIDVHTTPKGK